MRKQSFRIEQDGFFGVYYPCPGSRSAVIAMLGDSVEGRMVESCAKWLNSLGCSVMLVSPGEKACGYHNFPLEQIGSALERLEKLGNERFAIMGGSTTGMLAVLAASYYPAITLTVGVSASDFVMEGFYQDGKDGEKERPGDGESTAGWQGEPIPYLPFAYRHPEYGEKLKQEAKAGGNIAASREMFDLSEKLHPLTETETIKTERICGELLLLGAEDDCLWDTCRYMRRIEKRLSKVPHKCVYTPVYYQHGTHFVFPETLIKKIVPIGSDMLVRKCFRAARDYPRECKAARLDADKQLRAAVSRWQKGGK